MEFCRRAPSFLIDAEKNTKFSSSSSSASFFFPSFGPATFLFPTLFDKKNDNVLCFFSGEVFLAGDGVLLLRIQAVPENRNPIAFPKPTLLLLLLQELY